MRLAYPSGWTSKSAKDYVVSSPKGASSVHTLPWKLWYLGSVVIRRDGSALVSCAELLFAVDAPAPCCRASSETVLGSATWLAPLAHAWAADQLLVLDHAGDVRWLWTESKGPIPQIHYRCCEYAHQRILWRIHGFMSHAPLPRGASLFFLRMVGCRAMAARNSKLFGVKWSSHHLVCAMQNLSIRLVDCR